MSEDKTPSVEELRQILGDEDPDVAVFVTNFFDDSEANDRRSPLDVHRETLKTYLRPVDGTRWAVIGAKGDRLIIQEQHHHQARLVNNDNGIVCDHVNSDPARTVCGWSASMGVPFSHQVGCLIYWQLAVAPVGSSLTDGEIAAIRAGQGYDFGIQ